jgi:hypothetical protein
MAGSEAQSRRAMYSVRIMSSVSACRLAGAFSVAMPTQTTVAGTLFE